MTGEKEGGKRINPDAGGEGARRRRLAAAARRALAEAEARRAAMDARAKTRQDERDGPEGPEPARYGDWERKGIASDF